MASLSRRRRIRVGLVAGWALAALNLGVLYFDPTAVISEPMFPRSATEAPLGEMADRSGAASAVRLLAQQIRDQLERPLGEIKAEFSIPQGSSLSTQAAASQEAELLLLTAGSQQSGPWRTRAGLFRAAGVLGEIGSGDSFAEAERSADSLVACGDVCSINGLEATAIESYDLACKIYSAARERFASGGGEMKQRLARKHASVQTDLDRLRGAAAREGNTPSMNERSP